MFRLLSFLGKICRQNLCSFRAGFDKKRERLASATVGDKARRGRGVAPARPSLLAVGLCRLILQPGVPAPQRCPAGALPGKAGVGSGEEKTGRIVIARNGCNSKTFHVSCAASPDPFRALGPTRAFLAVSERACPADAILKASSARAGHPHGVSTDPCRVSAVLWARTAEARGRKERVSVSTCVCLLCVLARAWVWTGLA